MRFDHFSMHFVGVGGAGMSGIAELFCRLGAKVSGSDIAESAVIEHLRKLGIEIVLGHNANNVKDVDVVVYSSAVNDDNPEIVEARKRKIPIIRRAEALAELMRLRRGIAVAGSHGKTTTTSYLTHVFLGAQKKPMAVIGGRLQSTGTSALLDEGEWCIAEADESDGSFLSLNPEVVIITNIDNDHLDHYGTLERLEAHFYSFALKVPFYGYLVYCGDSPRMGSLFKAFPKRCYSYGFEPNNDYQIVPDSDGWTIFFRGQRQCSFKSPLAGRHNVLNAAASLIVSYRSGIPWDTANEVLQSFEGVERRLQKLGQFGEVEFYTDYAHHPTEIRCALSAFKELKPNQPLIVVFQPHRYSRTQLCWAEFLTCFEAADELILMDIYAASELPIEDVTGERLFFEINHSRKKWAPKFYDVSHALKEYKKGTIVFMGAGDIYKKAKEWLVSGIRVSR